MTPLFSIITVCYNAAGDLSRTIASIDAQTFKDFEHIIIDGASTDATPEVLKLSERPYRTYISEPDNGIYDAMNKGLGHSSGKYLIFLNAGDTFHNTDTLQLFADNIIDYGEPGIVYGQTVLVDRSSKILGPRHLEAPEDLTYHSFSAGMLVCHQAMAVMRRFAPLYDTRYRFSADYDWVIKCLQHSRHNVSVGAVVCNYLSEGVTTANHRASLIERFRIMSHYYGLVPTVFRHIGFLLRDLRRKLKSKN